MPSDASEQLVFWVTTRKVADDGKHSLPVSPAEAAQAPACCPCCHTSAENVYLAEKARRAPRETDLT